MKLRKEIGDKNGIANSFNNFGAIYYQRGDYTEAIDNFTKSLKYKEMMGDKNFPKKATEVEGVIF